MDTIRNPGRFLSLEKAGSLSGRGVEGDYEIGEGSIHGKFASHGVTREFSLEVGKSTVALTDNPFWLQETLLKQKITEGLDTLCNEQV